MASKIEQLKEVRTRKQLREFSNCRGIVNYRHREVRIDEDGTITRLDIALELRAPMTVTQAVRFLTSKERFFPFGTRLKV